MYLGFLLGSGYRVDGEGVGLSSGRWLADGSGQAGRQLGIEEGDPPGSRKQADLTSGEITDMSDQGFTQSRGTGIGHRAFGRVGVTGSL